MGANMMGQSKRGSCTGTEFLLTLMGTFMKDNGKMTEKMELEHLQVKEISYIRVNGKTEPNSKDQFNI